MMNTDKTSICIKCGKQRIVVGTKEETIGTSVVTYTETSCPDPECQINVVNLLASEEAKRQMSVSSLQRKRNNRRISQKLTLR